VLSSIKNVTTDLVVNYKLNFMEISNPSPASEKKSLQRLSLK